MKHIMLFEEFSQQIDEMRIDLKRSVEKFIKDLSSAVKDKSLMDELRDFINFQVLDPYIDMPTLIDRILIRFEENKDLMTMNVKKILAAAK